MWLILVIARKRDWSKNEWQSLGALKILLRYNDVSDRKKCLQGEPGVIKEDQVKGRIPLRLFKQKDLHNYKQT